MANDPIVYVIDDDPGALHSIRWLLESAGYTVQTFRSAADFLDAYSPGSKGCLLLDLRIPEMDGLGLQRTLISRGVDLPIVFLTGHGNIAQCTQAMKDGAVDFLEKPADDEQILAAVREALERQTRGYQLSTNHPEVVSRIERLTAREREILKFLYEGKSVKNIAATLGISFQTVAKHRARVLQKLEVDNEIQLIRLLGERHSWDRDISSQ